MKLNKANLSAVAAFAGEPYVSRFSLAAVRITNEDTQATDGHTLIRVTLPDGKGDLEAPLTLDASIAKQIGDNLKSSEYANLRDFPSGAMVSLNARIETPNGIVFPVDNYAAKKFPNVESVMPTKDPTLVMKFNPKRLRALMDAFVEFQDGIQWPQVTISFYESTEAIKLECKNGQTMTALLMPLKPEAK